MGTSPPRDSPSWSRDARGASPRAERRGRRGRPSLSAAALALVLASAVLHAGWNALVAGAKDTHATAAVAMLTGVVVFAIPAALTWRVEAEAWPFIAASAALELAYFALLAATYSRADYSFAYPVARGSAPILVLLISTIALGADISALAIVGILAVTGGVLLVRGVGTDAVDTTSLLFALGVGACIAGYTLVDDHGVEHAAPIPYFEIVLLLSAIPYALVVGHERLRKAVDRRSLPAGAGMAAAYILVLAALERAPAAPVAALRETSILLAGVGGGRRRLAGSALVVAGIAAVVFG